jgi:CHAD domain-containing protein
MSETMGHPRIPDGKHWYLAIHALPTVDRNRAMVGSASHLAGIEGAVSAQHDLRIAIKRYRYSLELLRFCYEEGIEDTIVHCKLLQDDLGLMHDYDILSRHIHGSRSRTLPKNIKKGLDELKVTIKNLRHQQFELFNEHFTRFLGLEPPDLRT